MSHDSAACRSPWRRLGGAREGAGRRCELETVPGTAAATSSRRAAPQFLGTQLAVEANGGSSCCSSYTEYEARYGVMRSAKRTQTYWRAGCWSAGGAAGGGAPLARRGTPPRRRSIAPLLPLTHLAPRPTTLLLPEPGQAAMAPRDAMESYHSCSGDV